MRYYYERRKENIEIFGRRTKVDSLYFDEATMYKAGSKKIFVVELYFEDKKMHYGAVEEGIANDIYLSPNFSKLFKEAKDGEVFELRRLMWKLRMKPLKREPWEDIFS